MEGMKVESPAKEISTAGSDTEDIETTWTFAYK